jgi:low affinity Fe/Cu permease
MLVYSGCRVGELVRLRVRDYRNGSNFAGDAVLIAIIALSPRRTRSRMSNATNQSASQAQPDRPGRLFPGGPPFESFSQKATAFVSGPWGTITLFATLATWAIAIPVVGWSAAYQTIDQLITVASFILLFLIQRSQSKGMLSIQVKLNELLAAAHRASPELINVEDRTESEVQDIHDRFQEIQQRGPGAHSISDILNNEQE